MKSSAFSQAGLLLIGGTVVLLIGALVKFDPENSSPKTALASPAADESPEDAVDNANDLPLPPRFPSALAQVVKLTRAGLNEEVILAYVKNSAAHYAPTADEMIYLHRVGVPESVMAALVQHNSKHAMAPLAATAQTAGDSSNATQAADTSGATEPGAEPLVLPSTPAPTPVAYSVDAPPAPGSVPALVVRPPADSDAAYFFDDLAPYGEWSQNADGEWIWQPTIEQALPDWTPYRDGGQWQFTDAGWMWQSAYPWGWGPFHYGRWYNDAAQGWSWQPGRRWSPAWVTWRKSQSFFGWAPLPPGVSLNMESFFANAGGANFSLAASSYTFVPTANFLSSHLSRHAASPGKTANLLTQSVVVAPSQLPGIPVEEVAAAVHQRIVPVPLRDVPESATRGPNLNVRDFAAVHPRAQISSASAKSTK